MVPGGLVVWWASRYFYSGRPCDTCGGRECDECVTILGQARRMFEIAWGPKLKEETERRR
jgi:hypothetical protein